MATVFAEGASLTVTEVAAVAILTPVMVSVAMVLSGCDRTAVAIEAGAVPIAYGGVPPLIVTICDVPTATVAEAGTAVSWGVVVVGCCAWVGELLLLQPVIPVNRIAMSVMMKKECFAMTRSSLSTHN